MEVEWVGGNKVARKGERRDGERWKTARGGARTEGEREGERGREREGRGKEGKERSAFLLAPPTSRAKTRSAPARPIARPAAIPLFPSSPPRLAPCPYPCLPLRSYSSARTPPRSPSPRARSRPRPAHWCVGGARGGRNRKKKKKERGRTDRESARGGGPGPGAGPLPGTAALADRRRGRAAAAPRRGEGAKTQGGGEGGGERARGFPSSPLAPSRPSRPPPSLPLPLARGPKRPRSAPSAGAEGGARGRGASPRLGRSRPAPCDRSGRRDGAQKRHGARRRRDSGRAGRSGDAGAARRPLAAARGPELAGGATWWMPRGSRRPDSKQRSASGDAVAQAAAPQMTQNDVWRPREKGNSDERTSRRPEGLRVGERGGGVGEKKPGRSWCAARAPAPAASRTPENASESIDAKLRGACRRPRRRATPRAPGSCARSGRRGQGASGLGSTGPARGAGRGAQRRAVPGVFGTHRPGS